MCAANRSYAPKDAFRCFIGNELQHAARPPGHHGNLAAVTPVIGTRSPHQTGKQLASSYQDHSLRKMARVTVVGIGPGPLSWLTMEAERELRLANKIFFRTNEYPAFHWLRELGKQVICFDVLY